MPRLTIGIPLRNSSQYLREAIESVIAQTVTDWILLAIDDASTDSTADIVRAYAEKDSRVHLMSYGPDPVSHAANWNRVIQLADTEYVSMFGHDDIMMPDLIAREIRMLDAHPDMAMVFAQGPLIDERGELLRSPRGNPMMQPNWLDDRVLPQYTLGPQLIREGGVHPSSVMLRTTIAQSISLFTDDMPLYLDIEYWSRIGDCGSVGYVAGDLLRYRVREDSAYSRAMRAGLNLTDTHRLFDRMMAHWHWDDSTQRTYKKEFFLAHATRALRAAEMAWKQGDQPTVRLQIAICLAFVQTAQDNPVEWIARWLNIRIFRHHFSSPRRLNLLTRFCTTPVLKQRIYQYYSQALPRNLY